MAKKKSYKSEESSDLEIEVDEPDESDESMEIVQCQKCGMIIFKLDAVNRGGTLYCQKCAEQVPMSEIQKYIFSFNDRNITLLYDGFMEHFDQIIGSVRSQYEKDVTIRGKFEPKLKVMITKVNEVVDAIADICGVKKG